MKSAVTQYRGGSIENTHIAHIAVVNATGKLLSSFNDPHRITLVRSAAKPAQAAIALETGAAIKFGFTSQEVALMCASHNSEPQQVAQVVAMLAKLGATEANLACGPHTPLSGKVATDWLLSHFEPTAACNTCSGKHAGVMAAALAIGAPIAGYQLPTHPIQVHTRQQLAHLLGLEEKQIQWGTDGCNLPTPAFALDRLARLYAQVASGFTPAFAQIRDAMTTYPELVAGEGRFCTALMKVFDGLVVGKMGADGSYGLGVADTSIPGGLGVAIKVEDGSISATYAVVCEVLEQLNIGSAQQREKLGAWHRPQLLNTAGATVGHLGFDFKL